MVGFINDPMASRSQRNNGISGVGRVAGGGGRVLRAASLIGF